MEWEVHPTHGWCFWEVPGEVAAVKGTYKLKSSLKLFCKVNGASLIYPCRKMNFHIMLPLDVFIQARSGINI